MGKYLILSNMKKYQKIIFPIIFVLVVIMAFKLRFHLSEQSAREKYIKLSLLMSEGKYKEAKKFFKGILLKNKSARKKARLELLNSIIELGVISINLGEGKSFSVEKLSSIEAVLNENVSNASEEGKRYARHFLTELKSLRELDIVFSEFFSKNYEQAFRQLKAYLSNEEFLSLRLNKRPLSYILLGLSKQLKKRDFIITSESMIQRFYEREKLHIFKECLEEIKKLKIELFKEQAG